MSTSHTSGRFHQFTRLAHHRGLLVSLTSIVILVGCRTLFGDDKCGAEHRSVSARGVVMDGGAQAVVAEVIVYEDKFDPIVSNFMYTVKGATWKGHLTAFVLVSNTDPTNILLELNILPMEFPELARGSRSSTTFPGWFELVANNAAVLRATLDMPSGTVVSIPLVTWQNYAWAQGSCVND